MVYRITEDVMGGFIVTFIQAKKKFRCWSLSFVNLTEHLSICMFVHKICVKSIIAFVLILSDW